MHFCFDQPIIDDFGVQLGKLIENLGGDKFNKNNLQSPILPSQH
jgi:hypothetical protein